MRSLQNLRRPKRRYHFPGAEVHLCSVHGCRGHLDAPGQTRALRISFSTVTMSSGMHVRLFPRRKSGDPRSNHPRGRAPLQVDVQALANLSDRPQTEAAKHFGISITALKQICRKLGMERWPYTRKKKQGSRAARDAASKNVCAVSSAAQGPCGAVCNLDAFDSSYSLVSSASTEMDDLSEFGLLMSGASAGQSGEEAHGSNVVAADDERAKTACALTSYLHSPICEVCLGTCPQLEGCFHCRPGYVRPVRLGNPGTPHSVPADAPACRDGWVPGLQGYFQTPKEMCAQETPSLTAQWMYRPISMGPQPSSPVDVLRHLRPPNVRPTNSPASSWDGPLWEQGSQW